jgi:periplasmic protein TonB
VESVTLVRGHPLLVAAAKEAVLQWEFEPYLVAGKAMKVVTNLQVTFNLAVPGQQK